MKPEQDIGMVKDRGDEALVLVNVCTVIRTNTLRIYFYILHYCVCKCVLMCICKEQINWKVLIHLD